MALIDIVKFNGLASKDWIVYKHFAEALSTSTQLIVGEGQVAVLVKGGRVCDIFGAGTYTLSTKNIPILSSMIKIPFGGRTPFTAEVYYINAATKMDINWGTSDPIQLVDPKYQIRLRIRAFGQIGLKISNYEFFIKELIGAMNGSEIVSYDSVMDHFKGFLITKVKSHIAQIIINEHISALEISARLNDISDKLCDMLYPDFSRFGLILVNFYIKSINFPDSDFERINKILEDKAAFDIMGDSRYTTKRSFDVYEGAANNQNGVAGAFTAGAIGFASGAAISTQEALHTNPLKDIYCPECHAPNSNKSKFCSNCGNSLEKKAATLKCPNCSATIPEGFKFCGACGSPISSERFCDCGNKITRGSAFCNNCGKRIVD